MCEVVIIRTLQAVILLLSCTLTTKAQLTESDTLLWGYQWSSSASYLSGNVERFLWINRFAFSHSEEVWGFKSSTHHQYGTIRRQLTENDVISKNFVYLYPRKRFYPFMILWLESHQRRAIDFRYQWGAGLSYVLIQKANHRLKPSLKVTYEKSKFQRNDFEEDRFDNSFEIDTWRLAGRLIGSHFLWKRKLNFSYEFWYQQSLQTWDNYRYYVDMKLSFAINKLLALQALFSQSYESIVLEGVQRKDTYFSYGLTLGNF
ncbi:MAG: DUF481 domain-containing protein [Microscillaceae bacterium]|nr:DUF481 domain-containing protein [Microscillaceae bacterium]